MENKKCEGALVDTASGNSVLPPPPPPEALQSHVPATPASPPKDETILYCDQPECLQNMLGGKRLTKTVNRVLKSEKGYFKCTQTRKQITKYGYLYWQCPGTKLRVTTKSREPVNVAYR